jgi:hypothetical protein
MKIQLHIDPRLLVVSLAACAASAARLDAQILLFERFGDTASDEFGRAVAMVGDVDADGADDFAVGAPVDNLNGASAGMVRVFSGRTLQVLFTWRGAAQERFGTSVAGAGDVDLDGNDDVIVGAPNSPSTALGYVRVFSGATGLVLYTVNAPATAVRFGHAVAGGGHVDGDAIPDLLVGAPLQSSGATQNGVLHVLSGINGAVVRTHSGNFDYAKLGYSAAFLGDLDGDGRDEYVCGAPAADQLTGTVEVRALDGASGAQLWSHDAASWNDELGHSLAPIADLNGDAKPDLLVGATQDVGVGCACSAKGFVRALDGVSGATIYQVNGASFYGGLGWSVTSIGDVNGNGYEDFACSQPGTGDGDGGCGSATQAVQVREGQTGALLLSLPSVGSGSQFGSALASGDANGDGLRDLLVGTPCADTGGTNSGSVFVYTIVRSVVSYCEAETNSLGCTPAISGAGSPSATVASPFDVVASSVLNNKSGLLFYGFKPRQTPFQGGHMCVVAPTLRTPIQSSGGSLPPINDCTGVFTLDFNARIQSGVDPLLVAGEEVFAQYWSRDPADLSTTNLSDALAFYIQP